MSYQIRVVCPKCQGTGVYVNFGTCFKCGGQGHFMVSQYTAKERGYMALDDFHALQARKVELAKQASAKVEQEKIDNLVIKTISTISQVKSVLNLDIDIDEQVITKIIDETAAQLRTPDYIAAEYIRPFIK